MRLLLSPFSFNPIHVALSASVLSLLYVGLEQADLIPSSAWAQYPIVVLFIGAFVVMTRYHLAEQDKWRQMVQTERSEAHNMLTATLTEQRQAQVELLKLMLVSSKEVYQSISKEHVEAFETALDKISANYYGLVQDREQAKKGGAS